MKFDIVLERVYPHPLQALWRALTEPGALGEWLMETDFAPSEGRAFQMWCENRDGDTDHYLCRVIALQPMSRMVWSWTLEGREDEGETFVEFVLEEVADGTRLTIRHSGDRDRATIDAFKSGWPHKLGLLEEMLSER